MSKFSIHMEGEERYMFANYCKLILRPWTKKRTWWHTLWLRYSTRDAPGQQWKCCEYRPSRNTHRKRWENTGCHHVFELCPKGDFIFPWIRKQSDTGTLMRILASSDSWNLVSITRVTYLCSFRQKLKNRIKQARNEKKNLVQAEMKFFVSLICENKLRLK
jgi:hypothetical protein